MREKAAVKEAPAGSIRISVIDDLSRLESVADEWNRLVEKSNFDSAFATWELFSSWARNFLEDNLLMLVLAHDGKELVGILPLMLERKRKLGRKITAIKSMTNSHNCKYDFILERSRARDVLKEAMTYITERYDWDFMRLDYVPDDSKSLSILRDLEKKGCCRLRTAPILESPFVRISGSWDEYVRKLDGSFRRNIRQYERRLDRNGPVQLKVVDGSADLEREIREAFAIEKSGWKGKAGTAIADSASLTRYYLDLAESMNRRGWFALYFLTVNGRKIAFDYCLRYKDRMNMLKTSYDPEYARHSPGKVLRAMAMTQLFQSRIRIYDLLGSKEEWKMKWTPYAQTLSSVLIFNRKTIPMLAFYAMSARDVFKAKVRAFPTAYRLAKYAAHPFRNKARQR